MPLPVMKYIRMAFAKRQTDTYIPSQIMRPEAVINSKIYLDWLSCPLSTHGLDASICLYEGNESKPIKCIHFPLNCRVKNISVNGG